MVGAEGHQNKSYKKAVFVVISKIAKNVFKLSNAHLTSFGKIKLLYKNIIYTCNKTISRGSAREQKQTKPKSII